MNVKIIKDKVKNNSDCYSTRVLIEIIDYCNLRLEKEEYTNLSMSEFNRGYSVGLLEVIALINTIEKRFEYKQWMEEGNVL